MSTVFKAFTRDKSPSLRRRALEALLRLLGVR